MASLAKGKMPVKVIRVVDGDTIKVKINGKVERVRFLYVDTPELNSPNLLEHFKAVEAKRYIIHLIKKAQHVYIEQGTFKRDHYGRLLAHVYVDDKNLQKLLLKKGLARCVIPRKAIRVKAEYRYLDEFKRLEQKARKEKKGIWEYAQRNGVLLSLTRKIE